MMKRKYYIIIITIVAVVATAVGYLYFSGRKKAGPPALAAKTSVVDLRPLIAGKLQQMVKDGSDGLYNLSMEKLEPDVLGGTLDLYNATLTPDSAVLKKLDSAKKAPDDVFKITLRELHIDGITINDLLKTNRISLDSVFIKDPVIETYHDPRPYNRVQRKIDSAATLYHKLMNNVKTISVNAITLEKGTFITNDPGKNNRKIFNYVTMHIRNLLIDSTTQYDKDRFLFAKKAELTCKDYTTRTADSLYLFRIGTVSVDAQGHTLTAQDVSLTPRGDKKAFEKKLPYRKDRYEMHFPKMVFRNVDWWSFANNEHFFSSEADIYDGRISDYMDYSLKEPPRIRGDNFASQLLMRIPIRINIHRMNIHRMNVSFEEYNPVSERSASITFNDIEGVLQNVSNTTAAIRADPFVEFNGSCNFMQKVPITGKFRFDLTRYKTGVFSLELHVGKMENEVINPVAEPLGLFSVKSGTMQKAVARMEGNNFSAKANVVILYSDLHITPLKKNDEDELKKKTLTSFIANVFLIKNNNPSGGEDPRNADVTIQRDPNDGYFKLVWKGILTGILKTIGVPEKYGTK